MNNTVIVLVMALRFVAWGCKMHDERNESRGACMGWVGIDTVGDDMF